MAGAKKLVIGAIGFLGSHVTRQLVARGDDVRVLIRRTSSTKAIEDLDIEYHYGDIFGDAALAPTSGRASRRRTWCVKRSAATSSSQVGVSD